MSTAQRPACEQQVPSAEPPDPGASPRRRPAVRPGRSRAGGEAESSSGAPRRSPLSAGSGCAVAQEPSPRGPLGYRCLCRGRSQPLHAARGRPGRAGLASGSPLARICRLAGRGREESALPVCERTRVLAFRGRKLLHA